jgi:hypothetical protein
MVKDFTRDKRVKESKDLLECHKRGENGRWLDQGA